MAESVDHVPSKQMFLGKRRPRGLEVPACRACNSATGQHEQVAALLGRAYPDCATLAEEAEFRKIATAVHRHDPEILAEMLNVSQDQWNTAARCHHRMPAASPINVAGRSLSRSIQAYAAKIGFAIHYDLTKTIVPLGGAVAARWYSNVDAISGLIPDSLAQFFGQGKTLQQGTWSVGDQFIYDTWLEPNGEVTMHYAQFRQSFACFTVAAMNAERLRDTIPPEYLYAPGCFRVMA